MMTDGTRRDENEEFRRFSLPFDPDNLLEEARESSSLEGLDAYHETKVVDFLLAADRSTLLEISYFCMEDPRLWEIYWEVIYDSANEVMLRKQLEESARKNEKSDVEK